MKRAAIILLFAAVFFTGCGKNQKHSETFLAMDTVMTVTCYSSDDAVLKQAREQIQSLEEKLSVTDEKSDIGRLNADGGGTVSGETEDLLRAALAICERTDGALDISLYPVLRAWGFTTGDYAIPDRYVLDGLLQSVGYEKIKLNAGNLTMPEAMQLDLGSVAKGYTGDAILAQLSRAGVKSAIVDLGGNIQTLGCKPDGSKWKVAVKNPLQDGYLGYLSLADEAAITSGSYERYFVGEDGNRYWHILDRSTGYPADSGLVSVTVVGKQGVLCDGLSTALFVMGLEKGLEFWRNSQDFEAIFVENDGTVVITAGLKDVFQLEVGIAWTVVER